MMDDDKRLSGGECDIHLANQPGERLDVFVDLPGGDSEYS
jgi:hypothetical protein